MARTISKSKGRRDGVGGFSRLIHAYFESPEYAALSPRAVKALIDLYCQYRGRNNGDLCASYAVMRPRGWTSKDQLTKAIAELIEAGWIIVTRQGGRHLATLYAVTFVAIDECGGKLDVKSTAVPLHLWKKQQLISQSAKSFPRTAGQCAPHGGLNGGAVVGALPRGAGQSIPVSAIN